MRLPLAHATCHHTSYMLSCDTYEAMLGRSAGKCERCARPPRGGRLVIDHDHVLGSMAVRGLICYGCNVIVGRVDAGRRSVDDATAQYLGRAFYLTLKEFKVCLGPGVHPDVASTLPRVEEALRRYVRRHAHD